MLLIFPLSKISITVNTTVIYVNITNLIPNVYAVVAAVAVCLLFTAVWRIEIFITGRYAVNMALMSGAGTLLALQMD